MRLVVLTASAASDLRDPVSWRARDIDGGGFDLDARVEKETLFLAYRGRPDALVMTVDPPAAGQVSTVEIGEAQYAQVRVRSLDLTTNAIESLPDLRGEHPIFQRLDRLYITTERAINGLVAHGNEEPFDGQIKLQGHQREVSLHRLFRSVVGTGSVWDSGRLLLYDSRTVPRNVVRRRDDPDVPPVAGTQASDSSTYAFRQVPGTATTPIIRYSTVEPFLPVHLVRFERIDGKGEQLDFRHRWPAYESLLQSRFAITLPADREFQPDGSPTGAALGVTWSAYRALDINHSDANFADAGIPAAWENRQFFPFGFTPDLPGIDPYPVDSLIGGCLAIDSRTPESGFYAYTDLGDEASRVIVDADVNPSDPGPAPDEKALNPDAVTGPGVPGQPWIEIRHEVDEWISGSLVGTPVSSDSPAGGLVTIKAASLASGHELLFDFLFKRTDELADLAFLRLPPDGLDLTPFSTARLACALGLLDDPSCTDLPAMTEAVARGNLFWTNLERGFAGLNTFSDYISPRHIRLSLSRHALDMTLGADAAGNVQLDRVLVTRTDRFDFQYRFHANPLGQGHVEARVQLQLQADEIQLADWLAPVIRVDSLQATINYGRFFTPAVLASDERTFNPVTSTVFNDPLESAAEPPDVKRNFDDTSDAARIVLSSKPLSQGQVTAENVRVPVSMPPWSQLSIAALLAALITLGLIALAVSIYSLAVLTALAGGLPSAVVFFALLTLIIYFVLPPVISAVLEAVAKAGLEDPSLAQGLNGSFMLTYLGEAVAEDVARRARAAAGVPNDVLTAARANRLDDQFWQTIYVSDSRAQIWIA